MLLSGVLVLGDIGVLLKIGVGIGYCFSPFAKLVLVLGIIGLSIILVLVLVIVKALTKYW